MQNYKATAERTDEAERLLTPPFKRSTQPAKSVVGHPTWGNDGQDEARARAYIEGWNAGRNAK